MTEKTLDPSLVQKVVEAFRRGATFGEVLGVSQDELENLYALGRTLYAAENYKDAEVIFRALTVYNSNDGRFWLGLGGCRQALENYDGAIDAYQFAALSTGMKDPTALLYAVRCLLKLGRRDEALAALEGIAFIGDESAPEVKKCHDQARALLAILQQQEAAQ